VNQLHREMADSQESEGAFSGTMVGKSPGRKLAPRYGSFLADSASMRAGVYRMLDEKFRESSF
jgi:hypothetical protein